MKLLLFDIFESDDEVRHAQLLCVVCDVTTRLARLTHTHRICWVQRIDCLYVVYVVDTQHTSHIALARMHTHFISHMSHAHMHEGTDTCDDTTLTPLHSHHSNQCVAELCHVTHTLVHALTPYSYHSNMRPHALHARKHTS